MPLSPELQAKAEEHLKHIDDEIVAFSSVAYGSGTVGAEYLGHLREHRALWMRFLGRSD